MPRGLRKLFFRRQKELEEQLQAEETKKKVEYAIKKAISEQVHNPDFRRELVQLVQKEQEKLKEFVVNAIRDQKDMIVAHVRKQQVSYLL